MAKSLFLVPSVTGLRLKGFQDKDASAGSLYITSADGVATGFVCDRFP